MTRASVALVALSVVAAAGLAMAGCREEPTIVIKFEPNDLAGKSTAGATKPADLGTAAAAAPADLAVAAKAPVTPAKPGKGKAAAECKTAADCVLVPLDCCDCANGGKQHAIAKKSAAADKAARADRCRTTACTMMLSTDPSCGQRPACVDGACVMVKK